MTGRWTTLHVAVGLPLSIEFADAETGRRLDDVRWMLGRTAWTAGAGALGRMGAGRRTARRAGRARPRGVPRGGLRRGNAPRVRRLRPVGDGADLALLDGVFAFHPLRPEVDLEIDVRNFDGTPARDARLSAVIVAGTSLGWTPSMRGAAGVLRVDGIPFLRGEEVSIAAGREGGSDDVGALGGWSERMPDAPGLPMRARIDLPDPADEFVGPEANSSTASGAALAAASAAAAATSRAPPATRDSSRSPSFAATGNPPRGRRRGSSGR